MATAATTAMAIGTACDAPAEAGCAVRCDAAASDWVGDERALGPRVSALGVADRLEGVRARPLAVGREFPWSALVAGRLGWLVGLEWLVGLGWLVTGDGLLRSTRSVPNDVPTAPPTAWVDARRFEPGWPASALKPPLPFCWPARNASAALMRARYTSARRVRAWIANPVELIDSAPVPGNPPLRSCRPASHLSPAATPAAARAPGARASAIIAIAVLSTSGPPLGGIRLGNEPFLLCRLSR